MSDVDIEQTQRSRILPLSLFGILLVSIAYFFFVPGFASDYAGMAAFLAIPASIGGLLCYIADPDGEANPMGCIIIPTLGLLAVIGLAVVFLKEGAICIAMILPIWIPAAIGGYAVNWWNARERRKRLAKNNQLYSVAWLLFPLLLLGLEQIYPSEWQSREVTRDMVIKAAPKQIWPLLVRIPDIASDEGQGNFTQDILGVPRPKNAEIVEEGDALVRKAQWGGDIHFEERIDRLEPQRAIEWSFAFPDRSIERYVDRHVSPKGAILRIESGGYRLKPLNNGFTHVRLTTRYRMRTRFAAYLGWWGEILLGDIENNVLAIIKERTERQ